MEQNVKIWDKVWEDERNQEEWTYLSQIIYDRITRFAAERALSGHDGSLMIEAGCGSGRITRALSSKLGMRGVFLDYSSVAVDNLRKKEMESGGNACVVQGDIFNIPIKDGSCDLVWNAGVIEHFTGDIQRRALSEMVRVAKPGGYVITLNPYAGCFLHTIGKMFVENVATYPYGEEIPITSLKSACAQMEMDLEEEESSIGFIVLFVGMLKRIMIIPGFSFFSGIYMFADRVFLALAENRVTGAIMDRLDRVLSRLFGGYLLVTVIKRKEPKHDNLHL